MWLPYLRFNLHHLSLVCCALLIVGMLFYGWPVYLCGPWWRCSCCW